jgi:hypothetical protein
MSFTAMGLLASAFGSAFQSVKGYLSTSGLPILTIVLSALLKVAALVQALRLVP